MICVLEWESVAVVALVSMSAAGTSFSKSVFRFFSAFQLRDALMAIYDTWLDYK